MINQILEKVIVSAYISNTRRIDKFDQDRTIMQYDGTKLTNGIIATAV